MTDRSIWRASLLALGLACGPAFMDEAAAQGEPAPGQPRIAPSSDPGYWTRERMENARPRELHPPTGYKPVPLPHPVPTDDRPIGAGESPTVK